MFFIKELVFLLHFFPPELFYHRLCFFITMKNLYSQSKRMSTEKNRLLNLTIAAGIASARGDTGGRADYGYRTSQLSGAYFFKFVSLLGIDALIECGANSAETSIHYAENFKGLSIAIEANPETFKERTIKSSSYGVLPICAALSDSKGKAKLMVPTNGELIFDGASSLSGRKDNSSYKEYEVDQSTLDIILEENCSHHHTSLALWIDVEGRALEVLKGAQSVLSNGRITLIYVEVETFEYWEKQSLAPEVDEFLNKNNFTAVIRDMQSKDQFNLLYVRDNLLPKCDELVIEFWRDLSDLKLTFLEKWMLSISTAKRRLASNENSIVARSIHQVAALLGSKSSRAFLSKKEN